MSLVRHGWALAGRRKGLVLTLAALIAATSLAAGFVTAKSATAAGRRQCGTVNYSFHSAAGGVAFNRVVAENVSCATARSVALAFLRGGQRQLPSGWRVRPANVTIAGHSEGYDYFSSGDRLVVGEDEAG